MHFIDMSDYNRAVRIYWWATTAMGALAVGCAVFGVSQLETGGLLKVIILMAVVFLAGLRPIRVPSTQSFITPGDVFIFLTALFLGAPAATLVAVTDAFAASCRTSRRWTSRIGGPALMSIAILVSSILFQRALDWLRHSSLLSSTSLLITLLSFSLVFFLLNSLLMAVHQALKKRESLVALWWANYSWAGLTYVASASAAGLIYLGVVQYGITLLIAAGPLVAIIFATCHFYFKQADERTKATERISRLHLATVEALATAIDAKDEITHDHVYRVQVYAAGLARHFGLGELEIEALKAGALLHDVGKIAVPDYILNKPGKLTAAEFEKMKIHTVVGAQIMERVNFPYPVVPIVRHHHERWDGRGYPDGLKGEQIPITARILTVVDCFDAIREDRQYRKGMTREQASNFLRENAGKQFDSVIVEAFLANLPKYEEEIVAHKANQQPMLSPTTQAGISESGRNAVPAAGLAQTATEPPAYVKHIHAAHAEVAALYEMAQTFNASLDAQDVVTLTVNRIERMIPFTTCAVYLRQEADDSAVATYVFGRNAEKIRGRSLAAGHGITGWVLINGRSMSNTDPMLDLNEFVRGNETGYRTAAVFPLTIGDETIGALALYTSELDAYTSDHLHLLESVAQLASTALQHAMLHEQKRVSAQTDMLTGLANVHALYARFHQDMREAKEQGQQLILLAFNVAGIRGVNDNYGYRAGDTVLAEAAHALRRVIGEAGMLYRLAGGEFICLIKGCDRDEAVELAARAQAEIAHFKLEARPGKYVRVGLSFGVAECSGDDQTLDEILHVASAATRQNRTALGHVQLISETPLTSFSQSQNSRSDLALVR
ncbi:MAG TPA: HD domain-containing phosphohydrolase [Blastocatellia bacterium]|jgi:diguanylate cyclase (GGDEF)-like protein/putative nucleotidyltransferase with HDIG domain